MTVIPNWAPASTDLIVSRGGTAIAFGLNISGQIQLVLAEQTSAGWYALDDASNTAPDDNKGILWSVLTVGGQFSFKHPTDGWADYETFAQLVNKYGVRLVTDYIPEANRLLDARFPAGGGAPTAPPASGPPFSDDLIAARWLASGFKAAVGWDPVSQHFVKK